MVKAEKGWKGWRAPRASNPSLTRQILAQISIKPRGFKPKKRSPVQTCMELGWVPGLTASFPCQTSKLNLRVLRRKNANRPAPLYCWFRIIQKDLSVTHSYSRLPRATRLSSSGQISLCLLGMGKKSASKTHHRFMPLPCRQSSLAPVAAACARRLSFRL